MGLKRYIKKPSRILKPALSVATGGLGGLAGLFGRRKKSKGEFDFRSEAAGQLVKKPVKRQAGAGQIEFTGEFLE